MIPRVGFLPPTDPRVTGTITAIQQHLTEDGFVKRYDTTDAGDGLPGSEGMFLACSFWLVDALHMAGQRDEATHLFERLLALRNDVGLLSEEWDPKAGRQLGNTPQAFSHFPSGHQRAAAPHRQDSPQPPPHRGRRTTAAAVDLRSRRLGGERDSRRTVGLCPTVRPRCSQVRGGGVVPGRTFPSSLG